MPRPAYTFAPKAVADSLSRFSHLSHYLQQVGTGLSKWKTGNLANMDSMFQDAKLFNGDVSSFNTAGDVLLSFLINPTSVNLFLTPDTIESEHCLLLQCDVCND